MMEISKETLEDSLKELMTFRQTCIAQLSGAKGFIILTVGSDSLYRIGKTGAIQDVYTNANDAANRYNELYKELMAAENA